ncbi:MAG: hypothetical protein JXB46_09050 [Candidatus Eisenbacteria bacterium]|nr:hypothetical protein [Candidatus Eisenbacteria bacterium]
MLDAVGKVTRLFDTLIDTGEAFRDQSRQCAFGREKRVVDAAAYEQWRTSCLTAIRSTFGSSSVHFDRFVGVTFFDYYNSTQIYLGILRSARTDLTNGYFFHKDLMLSVNIYHAMLSRARARAEKGQYDYAACVLEAVVEQILDKMLDSRRAASAGGAAPAAGPGAASPDALDDLVDDVASLGAMDPSEAEQLRRYGAWTAEREGASEVQVMRWIDWAAGFLISHLASRIVILN